MKKLALITSAIFIAFASFANEVLYFYPIKYQEQTDLFVKLAYPIDHAFIEYNHKKIYFENYGLLIEDIAPDKELKLYLGQSDQGQDYSLLDEAIHYKFSPSTNIMIDQKLYGALTAWATTLNQKTPLNIHLQTLLNDKKIAKEEILSFTQQFFTYQSPISKMESTSKNMESFFQKSSSDGDGPGDCQCNFVLNHFASVAPVKQGAGTPYQNGYNYLNSGNKLSEIIPKYQDFNASTPKWHRWYTHEKGPAHDLFLRTYDQGGAFNYQWSTTGINNTGSNSPSPNYAYNSFQFLCIGQDAFLPKDCDCTKEFCSLYEYNNLLKVIARKLKPLSNVSSTAEELAVVTLTDNDGVKVIDANRNVAFTECSGTFNFEFLNNLSAVAEDVVQVVIDVQDTTNGPPLEDVSGSISEVDSALIALAQSPAIIVTGDCQDKYLISALLRNFECFSLKANNPTTITLQSFTFLGVAGDRKWDNYAIARSDFRLQTVMLSSSEEGTEYCCSDKLGMHLYGSMDGPVSETDHNNNVTGIYYIFGPWDNFTAIGYAPVIPNNAHRGYFTYEITNQDCAPIKPKSLDHEMAELYTQFELEEESVATKPEKSINEFGNIKELIPKASFDLFPNPSYDLLNISLSNLSAGSELNLSVYNMLGQEIAMIYNGTNNEVNLNLKWSKEDLKEGTYYIALRENRILISTKAFLFKH